MISSGYQFKKFLIEKSTLKVTLIFLYLPKKMIVGEKISARSKIAIALFSVVA